ncbi:28383_t:CDS:2, partial [Dentiscutata erythropus]
VAADSKFNDNWERLAQGIREIQRKNSSTLSIEELYRNAYNMVLHKNGDKLYNGLRGIITQHLEKVVEEQIIPAFPNGGVNFLKVLENVWEDHKTCMRLIEIIFTFMDRVYSKDENVPPTYNLGLELFRDTIIRSTKYPIQSHLLDALLNQILLERENEIIDRSNIKTLMDMLLELTDTNKKDTVYAVDFEGRFLESSSEYYRVEGQMLISEHDAQEFMKKVENRLNEEDLRVHAYLSQTTGPKISNIVEEELIAKHFKTIIEMENSGLIFMLRNEKLDDLGKMYKLFGRVANGHEEMKNAISNYIQGLGMTINEIISNNATITTTTENITTEGDLQTETSVAIQWVQKVLDLKDKFDRIQNLALSNDESFKTAINEFFIAKNSKSHEFASLFIDDYLKKDLKETEEADNILHKASSLFHISSEKDIFDHQLIISQLPDLKI